MSEPSSSAIASLPTSTEGATLAELSQERPVFVVLLRHAGCTFHREALADLRAVEPEIDAVGARLAIVHMGAGDNSIESAERYDLRSATHVADPDQQLYKELGISRGRLSQLLGWQEFSRGASACLLKGHGVGVLKGDGLQLGGLALINKGQVVWKRPLERASERPDYVVEVRDALKAL
ncbi:AhpC/TSA family protein [Botrimarina mediterranea]|uniref:AhpC/TSA family protein n=1 Tax=Botrimarina mediterranea TaxID=2528022 RepID=A0A518K6Q6_9BACT|nr:AhpC/TSA family protein [Botrimarina mediterranea]QDV73457.1 hypothetical protein Spa11_16530 [Botrimarina mediterranea]QDV77974.1 hypothetical protein K2D_15790 [Planctomycetes bacterium K2D]